MAVHPGRRNQGIGSALVTRGIAQLREMGCTVIMVLGHAGFCGEFGFSPARAHGLACQWDGVPDEAFMVGFLESERDGAISGTVRYMAEFSAAAENAAHEADEPA
jgi:putative acetyltransferase